MSKTISPWTQKWTSFPGPCSQVLPCGLVGIVVSVSSTHLFPCCMRAALSRTQTDACACVPYSLPETNVCACVPYSLPETNVCACVPIQPSRTSLQLVSPWTGAHQARKSCTTGREGQNLPTGRILCTLALSLLFTQRVEGKPSWSFGKNMTWYI